MHARKHLFRYYTHTTCTGWRWQETMSARVRSWFSAPLASIQSIKWADDSKSSSFPLSWTDTCTQNKSRSSSTTTKPRVLEMPHLFITFSLSRLRHVMWIPNEPPLSFISIIHGQVSVGLYIGCEGRRRQRCRRGRNRVNHAGQSVGKLLRAPSWREGEGCG